MHAPSHDLVSLPRDTCSLSRQQSFADFGTCLKTSFPSVCRVATSRLSLLFSINLIRPLINFIVLLDGPVLG